MNKIKVLYDVFKTVKEKETFKGCLKLKAEKDKVVVLDFAKDFEVNTSSCTGKVKISAQADCDGNKITHESSTEFNLKNCCGLEGIGKHICGHNGLKSGGVKGCLGRITFMLNLLSNINLDEKDEKILLSLDLKEVCKDISPECCKGLCCEEAQDCCCHCDYIKEFLNCEYNRAVLTVSVNKKKEIEKIEVEADADDRSIKAELNLNW